MSDFKAKMHQNRFRPGSATDPAGGAYDAPPYLLVGWERIGASILVPSALPSVLPSVCKSGYPLSGYPDLSVNFMAAKNPDILK